MVKNKNVPAENDTEKGCGKCDEKMTLLEVLRVRDEKGVESYHEVWQCAKEHEPYSEIHVIEGNTFFAHEQQGIPVNDMEETEALADLHEKKEIKYSNEPVKARVIKGGKKK